MTADSDPFPTKVKAASSLEGLLHGMACLEGYLQIKP